MSWPKSLRTLPHGKSCFYAGFAVFRISRPHAGDCSSVWRDWNLVLWLGRPRCLISNVADWTWTIFSGFWGGVSFPPPIPPPRRAAVCLLPSLDFRSSSAPR